MRTPPFLACPVCRQSLARSARVYSCPGGHSFDLARSGYLNLLLANQRRTKDPGDGKAMMAARAAFLDQGHYRPIAQALAEAVAAHPRPEAVVDIGCGEGYYLRRLRERLGPAAILCGLDISRHAAEAAARQDPSSLYLVASAHRMPVLGASLDVVVSNFSPTYPDELARVLRPGGRVVVGLPGPRHLFGLKAEIYAEPAEHAADPPWTDREDFTLLAESRVRYDLGMKNSRAIGDLLAMTPYFWSADRETQARLQALEALDTEVDVVVRTYQFAAAGT
jgi:23S rRNA (guanine745-N1)-methyltransferase